LIPNWLAVGGDQGPVDLAAAVAGVEGPLSVDDRCRREGARTGAGAGLYTSTRATTSETMKLTPGAHRRSTARTTTARTANNAIVTTTKITSDTGDILLVGQP
jgi:hypothetical protein